MREQLLYTLLLDLIRSKGYVSAPKNSFHLYRHDIVIPATNIPIQDAYILGNGFTRSIYLTTLQNNRTLILKLATSSVCTDLRTPMISLDLNHYKTKTEIEDIVFSTKTIDGVSKWIHSTAKAIVKRKYDTIAKRYTIHDVMTPTVGVQGHVTCPRQKRIDPNYRSVFANPNYECIYCPFLLEKGDDEILCSGESCIDSFDDFGKTLEERKRKYYAPNETCPFCNKKHFQRRLGMYGEYWECETCGKRLSERKRIYLCQARKDSEMNRFFHTIRKKVAMEDIDI